MRLHGDRLYVSENAPRIRAVNLAATPPTMEPVLVGTTLCGGGLVLHSCGTFPGCDLVFDAGGQAYVSGSFCGGPLGPGTTPAVVRWDGASTFSLVAGNPTGATGDAVPGVQLRLGEIPALRFGPGGRLFLVETNRVRWLDLAGAPTAYLLAGSGTGGYAGRYVDVRASPGTVLFDDPTAIAFGPGGHAWIADSGNDALRLIWDLADVPLP